MTYLVSGLKNHADRGDFCHLEIKLDLDRMSDAERKTAADTLRRALVQLEQDSRSNN